MTFEPGDQRPAVATERTGSRPWPVLAWSLWDWGSAAFNAVITTFVFSVYITSDAFGDGADSDLGWALAGAGLLIAVFAPITGQRADRTGRRTFWLGMNTLLVVLASAGLFFVQPAPEYLWPGLLLLAAGNIFFEFAEVNYHAMLNDLSTRDNVGRISGLGWGMGYIGGIVLLLIVYFGFINPSVGLFGVTGDNGMDVRVTMLLAAAWFAVFSIPVLITMRRRGQRPERAEKISIVESYKQLFGTIAHLWRTDRNTAFFLLASAVYRDGLAGVFAFGGIIAAGVFGFSPGEVIVFAIAANVVAGLATIAFGALDDWFGPKRVIVLSLSAMIVAGISIFLFYEAGTTLFWVMGLMLCVFVGPAQSASRTFLARLIPKGKEGEMFGLYVTTGRASSFMAPAAYSGAILIGLTLTDAATRSAAQHWGILGIVLVLAVGLALFLGIRAGTRSDSALTEEPVGAVPDGVTALP